ncbi:BAI1-associated protein 3 isoform X2 [Lepeophtheirus salmonis]|uniref:BAI1-associated protein 3 isoform X2 n=1 Tax=Lepeophtheirus salmonis TaxID=72036 RepID=UPI003AF3FCD0
MSFFSSFQNLVSGASNTLNKLNFPESARKLITRTDETGWTESKAGSTSSFSPQASLQEYDRALPASPISTSSNQFHTQRSNKSYLPIYKSGKTPSPIPSTSPTKQNQFFFSPSSKSSSSCPSSNAKTKRVRSLKDKTVTPKMPMWQQLRSNTIASNPDISCYTSESIQKISKKWRRKDSSTDKSWDDDYEFCSRRTSIDEIFDSKKQLIDGRCIAEYFPGLKAFKMNNKKDKWPEFADTGSKIQDVDDGFFELYGGLSSHHHEKKHAYFIQLRNSLESNDAPLESSVGFKAQCHQITVEEFKSVYKEVLYTIRNKIGTTEGWNDMDGGCEQEDLYNFAQSAFHIDRKLHNYLLSLASEEKSPIVVLNVVVIEADSLEAKDPDGFSDPYCMLGICPGDSTQHLIHDKLYRNNLTVKSPSSFRKFIRRKSPSKSPTIPDSPDGFGSYSQEEHSIQSSLCKTDLSSLAIPAIPAKFVKTTTVKPNTLFPRWNERFRLDIEDSETDIFHLDIWDHDDESSVFDAVKKLNEVKGMRGLGRYFKQVAQSARAGSQDDFLGSVNILIKDLPCKVVEKWYNLEARSTKSKITGSIKLKIWLSTRENKGLSDEDDRWNEIEQHQIIYSIFIDYRLKSHYSDSSAQKWDGQLDESAEAILHQHEIQGDLSEFQVEFIRWKVLLEKIKTKNIGFHLILSCLKSLEKKWSDPIQLTKREETFLAESFVEYIEYGITLIRYHRQLFPPRNKPAFVKFENLLKSLSQISKMKLVSTCCSSIDMDLKNKIIRSIERSTADLFCNNFDLSALEGLISNGNAREALQDIMDLLIITTTDLEIGLQYYHTFFESILEIGYFTIIYKQYDKLITESLCPLIQRTTSASYVVKHIASCRVQDAYISFFLSEVCLALGDFYNHRTNVSSRSLHLLTFSIHYQEWFIPIYNNWIKEANKKLQYRFEKITELDRLIPFKSKGYEDDSMEKVLRSSSCQDLTTTFHYLKEFWKQLGLNSVKNPKVLIVPLVEMITQKAEFYADFMNERLASTSTLLEDYSGFKLDDDVLIVVNNLEHVHAHIICLPQELGFTIKESVSSTSSNSNSDIIKRYNSEEDNCDEKLKNAICSSSKKIDDTLYSILEHLIAKLRHGLKKHIFHLAWSPDTLPTIDSISPLLEFLDSNLAILAERFLKGNYYRSLDIFWELILVELRDIADNSTGEKMPLFFDRLDDALEILSGFFTLGLPQTKLHSSNYKQIHLLFSLNKLSTEALIDKYHRERLAMTLRTENSPYGTLTVRVHYNHECLYVDILKARDVIPLDTNGLSDPYVIIELLPKHLHHSMYQQTQIQKATLNPVFDESFEFPVSLEACRQPSSMICFTLMDHDVLSFDDFGGEAYLSLATIPGVSCQNSSIDNFHGLKLIHLPLLFQNNKEHPILNALESRSGDKMTQEFTKKHKHRIG